MLKSWKIFKTW